MELLFQKMQIFVKYKIIFEKIHIFFLKYPQNHKLFVLFFTNMVTLMKKALQKRFFKLLFQIYNIYIIHKGLRSRRKTVYSFYTDIKTRAFYTARV